MLKLQIWELISVSAKKKLVLKLNLTKALSYSLPYKAINISRKWSDNKESKFKGEQTRQLCAGATRGPEEREKANRPSNRCS